MGKRYLIGADIGTSNIKLVVLDTQKKIVTAKKTEEISPIFPLRT
ncbi:MAG: hypothetical protein Q8S19_08560 [Bacillota bacterium]|nr:hypothetical protein [Bacillota bacterium]